jgi:hypothetical protein
MEVTRAALQSTPATTAYRRVIVDGVGIFYREAGPKDAPTIVLLISAHPERLQALIIQNANVYKAGLGFKWSAIAQYWADPKAHLELFDAFVSLAATEQRHSLVLAFLAKHSV